MLDRPAKDRPTFLAVLVAGLWLGVGLALLRMAVLFLMEGVAHGSDLKSVFGRVATALPGVLVEAFSAGVGFALIMGWARSGRAPGLRRVAMGLVFLLAAGAFLALLAGWVGDDYSRRVGLGTQRGKQTVAALALLSLLGSAYLAHGFPRRTRAWQIAPPVLLGLALPVLARAYNGRHADSMEIRQVVGSLLADPAAWVTIQSHGQAGARADVLTPCGKYALDGADMPSLVLPPPGELQIDMGGRAQGARLVARVGIDQAILFRHGDALAGHAVRFEVLLDGARVFEQEIAIEGVGDLRGSEWVDVGGDAGLDLDGAKTLTLRTSLQGPMGAEVEFAWPLDVGFGGMLLERRWSAERTPSSPERPNIVLVVMDTLRRDRLQTYGYERPTSPNLDRLAQRGVVFEAAYSTSSWTWPSTASILTGVYPEEHGVVGATSCYLADELQTVAESLQQEGFTTAAWSGNPLIVPDKNFDQGFEFYEHAKAVTRKSRVFMPGALEWLESMAGTRFFMYLHLTDPHAPLAPRPEGQRLLAADVPDGFSPKAIDDHVTPLRDGCGFTEDGAIATELCVSPADQRAISELYDACVWTGDYWLGQLLDTLERLELDDETLVVFTSDHGEELFDHGLVTHGHGLHEELVGIPLVFAGPGVPRGRRVTARVSNRHIGPTLARIARGEKVLGVGAQVPVDGADPEPSIDLRRAFVPETSAAFRDETVRYSTTNGWWNGRHPQPVLGILSGSQALHFAPEGAPWRSLEPAIGGEMALYDKVLDPLEFHDLAPSRMMEAEALRDELLRRLGFAEARRPTSGVRAGGSTVEMLRGLGYLGDDE